MRSTNVVEALHGVRLFRGLTRTQLQKIARVTREQQARAGEVVVREGTYRSGGGPAFFLIGEGRAEVTVRRKKVGTLGPGDTFGEMSLLDGKPRSASVTAKTAMTLYRIRSWDFLKIVKAEPTVAINLLKTMASWLREKDKY